MKTKYLTTSQSDLEIAAELLQQGELVVFPTETVYGLGADALNPAAVGDIFHAKGRPSDNPLIVHIANIESVKDIAANVDSLAMQFMDRFWPGPLTLVLPKRPEVPDSVTAGLNTVAVRYPSHPVACELIRLSDRPIAAPSANRSGRPSATTWQAAAEDLQGRVAAILCGDPTEVGLESTVIDLTSLTPRVLRPGGVTLESLQAIAPNIQPYHSASASLEHPVDTYVTVNSPGLRHQHYQPRAAVILIDRTNQLIDKSYRDEFWSLIASKRIHYIGLSLPPNGIFQNVIVCRDLQEYGARLFDCFRQADLVSASCIVCESVVETGLGVALMDRLRRAAAR